MKNEKEKFTSDESALNLVSGPEKSPISTTEYRELGIWLENQLFLMEAKFESYVTNDSLRHSLRRQR
jgi:hypothetical protein